MAREKSARWAEGVRVKVLSWIKKNPAHGVPVYKMCGCCNGNWFSRLPPPRCDVMSRSWFQTWRIINGIKDMLTLLINWLQSAGRKKRMWGAVKEIDNINNFQRRWRHDACFLLQKTWVRFSQRWALYIRCWEKVENPLMRVFCVLNWRGWLDV